MDSEGFFELITNESSLMIAAHEMKTPLSIVRQLSLMLEEKSTEISQKEKDRIIKQISLTSERALRIANDLTKIAKLEDAMFDISLVNTRKICVDIHREMAKTFALHNRKLVLKNVKINDLVIANYDLLRSILLNFSDNALYSSDKNTKVEVSISKIGEKIRFSVRDFGEELPIAIWRIVKNQQNQPVRAASRPQNSGLGLYIAQNFAEFMGGKVGVIRHRNGNTFYVELNRSEQLTLL